MAVSERGGGEVLMRGGPFGFWLPSWWWAVGGWVVGMPRFLASGGNLPRCEDVSLGLRALERMNEFNAENRRKLSYPVSGSDQDGQ